MKVPFFSIITVTYNAVSVIDVTLLSVKTQSFDDYEYLVIDGASTDDTLSRVNNAAIRNVSVCSEPDNGLYDAMNKGIAKAKGQYLIFLNAGDSFYDSDTLYKIADTAKRTHADIVYGQTVLVDNRGVVLGPRHLKAPAVLEFESFKQGMLVCHQAFVARRCIVEEYNLGYRFSADYEWCLRCLQKSKRNAYSGYTLIKFLTGGTTTKNHTDSLKERYRIMCKYYGSIPTFFRHLSFIPRYIINKVRGVS